jgi:DNA invertase Pin-like site-specific DNA recombinase
MTARARKLALGYARAPTVGQAAEGTNLEAQKERLEAWAKASGLVKAGADLVSVIEAIDTTTAAGKMVFRLLAVLAEFERDLVSERTTAALHYKRAAGERTGGVPYGFDLASDGIRLVPNGKEQGTVKRVLAERAGGQSMRAIARGLVADSVPTKNGGQWTPVQISSILSRTAALDPGNAGV